MTFDRNAKPVCPDCQGSEIQLCNSGHNNVVELPCLCVCVAPTAEAFEAYQNQCERDAVEFKPLPTNPHVEQFREAQLFIMQQIYGAFSPLKESN